jgi:cold-inducible RNA-binding protein
MDNSKVYVGNLPWTTTEEELTSTFASYGTVTEAKVIMDRDTGRSKGFAFVTFATADEANRAVEESNGMDMGGRMLKVSIAENRPPRQPRGDGYSNDYGGVTGGGRANRHGGNRY